MVEFFYFNNRQKAVIVFFIWWIFFALLIAEVLSEFGLTKEQIYTDAIFSICLMAIFSYGIFLSQNYFRANAKNFLYPLALGVGIASLENYLGNKGLSYWFANDPKYLYFLFKSSKIRFVFILLMVLFFTFLSWLWNYIVEKQNELKRVKEAEQLLKEAELSSLRQQLQPHFLFNSLNSISALVGYKPEEARKMIQQLSDFLRGTLKKDEQQLLALRDEIQHMKLYLEIEKVRFGHRLDTRIICDEALLIKKLPSLLLQPIVENAIKFGLYDTIGEITIQIELSYQYPNLIVEVKNPYDQTTVSPKKGLGFGLTSVKRRLYLLYARQDLLETIQVENYFITKVKIPQIE